MDFKSYSKITSLMRGYFQKKRGFIEVPTQSNLSILAACEDPETIGQFVFGGVNYPLPQTGQMVLEEILLKNPDIEGVFCQSTSFRDEPFPIPGRHDKIFPMFEFEAKGDFEALKSTEKELLLHLGFEAPMSVEYADCCKKYNTDILKAEHEESMQKDFGNSISLERFPVTSHPFWNMEHVNGGIFNKIDVILYGMETIGSAARSCNVKEMKYYFDNVSNGKYAKLLFNKFTKERVMKELEEYLSLEMIPRYGGGIGITRMERAMKLAGLINNR